MYMYLYYIIHDYINIFIGYMEVHKLTIKQLDIKLDEWRKVKVLFQPKNGWISTIRKALGMTTKQLATRLGVNRSRIIKIESDENREVLTMKTLITTANALECDLVYALVPRQSLQTMLDCQAQQVAKRHVAHVAHNMLLEKQELSAEQNKEHIKHLKEQLLKSAHKNLWNDK